MGDERVETLANEVANLASSASSQQRTLSCQQQTLKEIQERIHILVWIVWRIIETPIMERIHIQDRMVEPAMV